uniref:Uncharacterized protein n=1 Tax=Magallana gigas TaxID=29159 RepID=K1PUU7_MAGGI
MSNVNNYSMTDLTDPGRLAAFTATGRLQALEAFTPLIIKPRPHLRFTTRDKGRYSGI